MRAFSIVLVIFGSLSFSGAGCGGNAGGDPGGVDSGLVGLSDAGAFPGSSDAGSGGGGNISLGGAQDFGYFRNLLDANQVPRLDDFDAAGFFAEHYLELPPPDCGDRVCLQALLGVMPNLLDGEPMSMIQLGLNTPVTVDPNDRPPLTLALAVDVSGSMASENKIEYVRSGLQTLIDNLRDDDQIAIITYSDTAQVVAPLAAVGPQRAQLQQIAAGLMAGGGTNFYAGLELAYQQVQGAYDLERQNRVIVLSDGQPTAGIVSSDSIMAMSAGYNSAGLGLTTVGLGVAFNATLMRGLAEQGHGNHYFLESSSAVQEVFAQELAYFTVPVAFDVDLQASAGSHYQFVAAHGSSFWTSTESGGGLQVPSVFLAHRVSGNDTGGVDGGVARRGGGSALLLELAPIEPTPDPTANEAVVADISVSFRAPGETTLTFSQLTMNYPYNATHMINEGYWVAGDPAIAHKSFVMLNLYLGIERACRAFWEYGDTTEAIAQLLRVEAAARDYAAGLAGGDADMIADADLVAKLVAVLVFNGATMPDDPGIPADPWPAN